MKLVFKEKVLRKRKKDFEFEVGLVCDGEDCEMRFERNFTKEEERARVFEEALELTRKGFREKFEERIKE